jgi:tetratricopeptide (TPR) repeat protein
MIVKDESHVIERCLTSVRDHIDHWVIVDTGSTDGTQDLIRGLLADVPGILLERPWKNFGHNRSEALAAAREHADYSFVIDADEVFHAPPGFTWPTLTADWYKLTHRTADMTYWRGSLVANRLAWHYEGVLHEYLEAEGAGDPVQLSGPEVVGHYDGGRSQNITTAQKYARDAKVLEDALLTEPDNARYQYYLARSYRDSEQREAAIEAYRRRTEMGEFAEEVYDSFYWIAKLGEVDGDAEATIAAYLRAWEARPTRAEPLVALARFCREQKRFALGRMVAAQAVAMARPDDLLWIEEDVYAWRAKDEYAVASYWTGQYVACAKVCQDLLASNVLPESQRARIKENLGYALAKLPAGVPQQQARRPKAKGRKR